MACELFGEHHRSVCQVNAVVPAELTEGQLGVAHHRSSNVQRSIVREKTVEKPLLLTSHVEQTERMVVWVSTAWFIDCHDVKIRKSLGKFDDRQA